MSKLKEPSSFIIICFSVDNELYKPTTIIRQYLICEECSNVKYLKDGVEYDHNLNKDNKYAHFKFIELLNIDKSNPKCNLADSYFISINLEKEEIFEQLDSIFNYIQNNGNTDKKIYVIGYSMGGVIASHLSSKYKCIKTLILASPAFRYIGYENGKLNYESIITKPQKIIKQYGGKMVLSRMFKLPFNAVFEFRKLY